jgi:hypothetical protein
MKPYTKTYYKFFGYPLDENAYVPCEICNNRAVDINHIIPRSRRPDLLNDIINLMANCRS